MLWWELPGLSSITSRALMSLPKTWLWVSARGYKGNEAFQLMLEFEICLNVLCRNCCMQLAGDIQRLHHPHVHL